MRAFDDLAEASAAIISVLAFPLVQPSGSVVSYESRGREDHMLYYMTSGERTYARNGKAYLRVCAGDILANPVNYDTRDDAPRWVQSRVHLHPGACRVITALPLV